MALAGAGVPARDRVGHVERKAWGWAFHQYRDAQVAHTRLVIDAGGYSSKHYHRATDQYLRVLTGTLLARVWETPAAPAVIHRLPAGAAWAVPAGVVHQFEAAERTVAVESYYPGTPGDGLERDDIVRLTEGGLREPGATSGPGGPSGGE